MTHTGLFRNARQAIEWYKLNNPARMLSVNLIEQERGRSTQDAWGDADRVGVHACICLGLKSVVLAIRRRFPTRSKDALTAFDYCVLGNKLGEPIHPDDAAKLLHSTGQQVITWLTAVWANLESEFKKRELID